MSYRIELTGTEAEMLARLPRPVQVFVKSELARLATNPTGCSKPAEGLYPSGQLFEMRYSAAGVELWIGVVFRYTQDEATLSVTHLYIEYA